MQLTQGSVRADVAAMLHRSPGDLTDAENLFESGLDSVRLLTLIERWREAGAVLGLVDLAERPTLGAWFVLLGVRVPAGSDA